MNLRPLGYEPNELPDCSTPRQFLSAPRCAAAQEYSKRLTGFKSAYGVVFLGLSGGSASRKIISPGRV